MSTSPNQPDVEPVWCAVANVVETRPYGPGGEAERSGTKHFSPGTKIYVRRFFWRKGGEQVEVVGRHRGSHQLVTMVIRSSWLTNWRVKLVYEPQVVSRLRTNPDEVGFRAWDGSDESRKHAEEIVRAFGGTMSKLKGLEPVALFSRFWRAVFGPAAER